jgi:AcrR family transcriptional regulator
MRREDFFRAALEVMKEAGVSGLTLEEVARRCGVSRPTVYRYFPGGREELVGAVVAWEALRWLEGVGAEIDDIDDVVEAATVAIIRAHETLVSHEVLNAVLQREPDVIMPLLSVEASRVLGFVHLYVLTRLLGGRVPPGVDVEKAADYVARMLLSVMTTPGRWDLQNPDAVRRLVEIELFSGVISTES